MTELRGRIYALYALHFICISAFRHKLKVSEGRGRARPYIWSRFAPEPSVETRAKMVQMIEGVSPFSSALPTAARGKHGSHHVASKLARRRTCLNSSLDFLFSVWRRLKKSVI